jgi:chromosome segregation ATPase
LKIESENCSRLRKQFSELTVLKASIEQSLNEKLSSLKEAKESLEMDLAKVRAALEKEESIRQQNADLHLELENRTHALQTELAKTRERETRIMEDNKALLNKLVQLEKSSTSTELQYKALCAKYEQEVQAFQTEMERKTPSDQEDQVKGKITISINRRKSKTDIKVCMQRNARESF